MPKDGEFSSDNLIKIDTTPLPQMKRQVDVARLPSNALMDAFGLPMFVPIEKTKGKSKSPADVAGGEIGRIVSRIAINGSLPNQEVILETYIVPLGGSFAVKLKENEVILLYIKEITNHYITFGWSKDNTFYRYALPEQEEADTYIEDIVAKRKKRSP